jgi:hypothetical protein
MIHVSRIVCLVLALLMVAPAGAEAPKPSFSDWVRTLYVGTAILHDTRGKLSEAEMRGLFTPEIQALLGAKVRTQPASDPAEPMLKTLFGWGALPNSRIEILSVTPNSDNKAAVKLTIDGFARWLVLTGLYDQSANAWQIDDIDYGEGGPDRTLRERL